MFSLLARCICTSVLAAQCGNKLAANVLRLSPDPYDTTGDEDDSNLQQRWYNGRKVLVWFVFLVLSLQDCELPEQHRWLIQ